MIALTKGGAVEAHGHLVCSLGILMSGAESDLEGCRKRKERERRMQHKLHKL